MKNTANEIDVEDVDLFLNTSLSTKRIVHSWYIKQKDKETKITASGIRSPQLKLKFKKHNISWFFTLPDEGSSEGNQIKMNVMLDFLEMKERKSLRLFIKLHIIDNNKKGMFRFYKHLSVENHSEFYFKVCSDDKVKLPKLLTEGECTLKCHLYFHIDDNDECKHFIVTESSKNIETKGNILNWKYVLLNFLLKMTQQVLSIF